VQRVQQVRRILSWADNALLAVVVAVVVAVAVAGGGWFGYQRLAHDDRPRAAAVAGESPAEVRALEGIVVKGRAPKTGYARARFGQGWIDVNRNGCDTRNDILQRDLSAVELRAGNPCVVERGRLVDPYSGETTAFVKGNSTSTAVQIDHVVALSDAWQKGAQSWTEEERIQFANDPANLLAVGQRLNQQKGDGDAATWLPPKKSFRCEYVSRQIEVKRTYGLWVTAAERDAMARVLGGCAR
jgi:hypothetical protein